MEVTPEALVGAVVLNTTLNQLGREGLEWLKTERRRRDPNRPPSASEVSAQVTAAAAAIQESIRLLRGTIDDLSAKVSTSAGCNVGTHQVVSLLKMAETSEEIVKRFQVESQLGRFGCKIDASAAAALDELPRVAKSNRRRLISVRSMLKDVLERLAAIGK